MLGEDGRRMARNITSIRLQFCKYSSWSTTGSLSWTNLGCLNAFYIFLWCRLIASLTYFDQSFGLCWSWMNGAQQFAPIAWKLAVCKLWGWNLGWLVARCILDGIFLRSLQARFLLSLSKELLQKRLDGASTPAERAYQAHFGYVKRFHG